MNFEEKNVTKLGMDRLFRDIRNFFKKLESGQIEIEAGQWELHKDVCKIKKLFEELKKLKDNVEEMRMTNVKQMSIIKNLERKLEAFKNRFNEKDGKRFEANVYENDEKRDSDSEYDPKNSRLMRSEDIIEITSCTNTHVTSKSISDKAENESRAEGSGKNNSPSPSRRRPMINRYTSPTRNRNGRDQHNARKTRNEILQRYLDDSAKYSKKRPLSSPEKDYNRVKPSQGGCFRTFAPLEAYTYRHSQDSISKNSDSYDRGESSDSYESIESVMPRVSTARSPKNGAMNADFLKQAKCRTFLSQRPNSFEPFRDNFRTLELFRAPRKGHKLGMRGSKILRCGYCNKVCYTPEMLASHINKCRLLMRSRFKRY